MSGRPPQPTRSGNNFNLLDEPLLAFHLFSAPVHIPYSRSQRAFLHQSHESQPPAANTDYLTVHSAQVEGLPYSSSDTIHRSPRTSASSRIRSISDNNIHQLQLPQYHEQLGDRTFRTISEDVASISASGRLAQQSRLALTTRATPPAYTRSPSSAYPPAVLTPSISAPGERSILAGQHAASQLEQVALAEDITRQGEHDVLGLYHRIQMGLDRRSFQTTVDQVENEEDSDMEFVDDMDVGDEGAERPDAGTQMTCGGMDSVVERLESYLECTICVGTLETPTTLRCGHTFCMACILQWWDSQSIVWLSGAWRKVRTCPVCRKNTSVHASGHLSESVVLKDVLGVLGVIRSSASTGA